MRFQAAIPILVTLVLVTGGGIWAMRAWETNATTEEPVPPTSPALTTDTPATDSVEPSPAIPDNAWFTTITESTGIDFLHNSGSSSEKPFPSANGSGLAALDYDLDGLYDLYFATGTPFPIEEGRAEPINRCYRNLGSAHFQDVTSQCGLGHNGYSAGLAVGDYDSDGFPDVYVNCFGDNVLYHNLGDGTFEIVTESARVDDDRWGTSAAFFDYDGDGSLDLYVCNYAKWSWETRQWCGDRARHVRVHCGPHSVEPEKGILFRNLGDGSFADVTDATGLGERIGRAQGVIATDLNRDGHCDLYIGNDLHPNSLFINRGDGAFRDFTDEGGAAYDYKGSIHAGMGVAAADVTGDGFPELFVTNFSNEHNVFYVNSAQGLFHEASQQFGLYSEGYPWVGWGTALADFDLDGGLDLVLTNGHVDENRDQFGEAAPYAEPPLAWRQDQGRFQFLGAQAGAYFAASHVGRGLIVVDFDNDGDQDLVIGHQDAVPAVLRNERFTGAHAPAGSYCLRLVGNHANRDAVGAAITMRWGEHTRVLQVNGGGSYLSSHDPRIVFASPTDAASPSFEIQWPRGQVSVIDGLQPGINAVIVEPRVSAGMARVYSLKQ